MLFGRVGAPRRRYLFGQAAAGGGGIDTAAQMAQCIAAGGSWNNGICSVELATGEGGDGIDLQTTPPGGTTPGAVPVREANWDLDATPYATYRLAMGDTLSGLAITYLGDGTRWREIWDTGSNRQQFPSPDMLNHVGPLDMPAEARDRMRAWLKTGKTGKPGELAKSKVEDANKSKAPYIAAAIVGTAAIVALGAAIYVRS